MAGNTPNHGLDTLNSVSEEKNTQNNNLLSTLKDTVRKNAGAALLGLSLAVGAPNVATAQETVDPNTVVVIAGKEYTYRTLASMKGEDLERVLSGIPEIRKRVRITDDIADITKQNLQAARERNRQATERNRQATERNRQATERNRQATERNRQATERNRQATERNRQATEMAGQAQAFEQAVHTALDPNTPINERRDAVKQVLELRDQLDFLPEETKRNATIAMNDIKQKYNIVP